MSNKHTSTWTEIQIPVPWGHIAGKWWGPQNRCPIIATHNWQENSGTFDTLIPLLLKNTSVLAIDFPGCGLSTNLPPGVVYHIVDYVTLLRRIVKHFNWSSVALMGHSMGAAVNFTYAILYPNEVDFLISLDSLKPYADDDMIKYSAREIDRFLELDESPPHEMEQEQRGVFHSEESAYRYILERGKKTSNTESVKFNFTVDPRLIMFRFMDYTQKVLVDNANRISCPVLYCRGNQSPQFEQEKNILEVIDVIKKNTKHFEMHRVEGGHHVHLHNPERLKDILNNFLKECDMM